MKPFNFAAVLSTLTLLGCAAAMPVSLRLSGPYEERARTLRIKDAGPIAIRWVPSDFPSRIDIQGASGFVGGGARVRVPIGEALSSRIRDVLDKAIGLDPDSKRVITITIIEAKSRFKCGFASAQLTYGETELRAKFDINDISWEETFISKYDKTETAATYAYYLEKSWDEVSLQVGKSIVAHSNK